MYVLFVYVSFIKDNTSHNAPLVSTSGEYGSSTLKSASSLIIITWIILFVVAETWFLTIHAIIIILLIIIVIIVYICLDKMNVYTHIYVCMCVCVCVSFLNIT